MLARPQACCEQPLNDGLNFRPKFWQSGWPSRNLDKRAGIGSDVEGFIRADARVGAGRDVAHRVAAGFARGDARGGQRRISAGRIVDMNVVKLNILPRGHVRDAVRVFLGQLRQRFQLAGVQPSRRES